jgi:hypothetical protein
MLKEYKTANDYLADSNDLLAESKISHIVEGNVINVDGKNVLVDIPVVGDIIVADASNIVHFIAHDTFKAWDSTNQVGFPTTWKTIGVIGNQFGANKYHALWKSNAGKKWSTVYRWKVTGFASLTSVASVKVQGGVEIGSLSDLDGTAATLIAKYNALSAAAVSGGTTTVQSHMYAGTDGSVYLIWSNYNANPSGWAMTGVTLTANTGTEINALGSLIRMKGLSTYWGGCNRARFYEYYSANGTTPTANVALSSTDVVNKNAFETSQYCQLLRETYGDYNTYLDAEMIRYPYTKGILSPDWRDGRANTDALKNVKYQDVNGVAQTMYLAADYANAAGIAGVSGFEPGDFFMPSIYEMVPVWNKLTYGLSGITRRNSDVVNRSLAAIGGSGVSVTTYCWSSSRHSATGAWYYDTVGCVGNYFFYSGFSVVPFCAFEL